MITRERSHGALAKLFFLLLHFTFTIESHHGTDYQFLCTEECNQRQVFWMKRSQCNTYI